MTELKPCPFCGGEAEYIERGNGHTGLTETIVRCKSCNTKQVHKWMRYRFDMEFVRARTKEAWNKRMK